MNQCLGRFAATPCESGRSSGDGCEEYVYSLAMRPLVLSSLGALLTGVMAVPVSTGAQGAGTAAYVLSKAATAAEITNDQRVTLLPPSGQTFLWATLNASGSAQTIDLTKVAVAGGGASFPLVGVDSAWDGDPKQFSMMARARTKDGRTIEPLEETRSEGSVAFAFTPGKIAQLKIIRPPASVCLLFVVPQGFSAGQVSGLGAKPAALPALTK